jgi:hypothetical protein
MRETAAERREAAAGRAMFRVCLLAALALALRGHWWLMLGVAAWWLVGLAYFAWNVRSVYRREQSSPAR